MSKRKQLAMLPLSLELSVNVDRIVAVQRIQSDPLFVRVVIDGMEPVTLSDEWAEMWWDLMGVPEPEPEDTPPPPPPANNSPMRPFPFSGFSPN